MERPTISACMIVKNEEKSLHTCLKSITDYVDETVIVDTGSTDSTVSIAESFGARVYHHPWEDHFSKHRNQSFSYARGDWILIIDADEELLPGSGEVLLETIHAADEIDAIAAEVVCVFEEGAAEAHSNSIRIVRNYRGLRYEGRVHNYIVGVKKAICAPIQIFHHGYDLDEQTKTCKFERTTALLKKDIEENPVNPRPRHFLAASYLSENMYKEAAKEAEKAISFYEAKNLRSHNYLWSLYIASSAYLEMGEIDKAEQLAKEGIEVNPDHLDSHYILAAIGFKNRDPGMFDNHMERYLEIKALFEKDPAFFGEMVHNTFASQWLLHLFKGFLLLGEKDEDRARIALVKSKRLCPDVFLYHTRLGDFFRLDENFPQAERQYLMALKIQPEDSGTIWALSFVCEKLNRTEDQSVWLEKLLNIDREFPNAEFQLGLARMRMGNFNSALSIFRNILALDSKSPAAQVNECLCLRGLGRYEESVGLSENIETAGFEDQLAVVSNLAHCYYESGNYGLAIKYFQYMIDIKPEALEPPVYLSKLFLENKDIEVCLTQCSRLLSLLNMDQNIVLDSLWELGELYFQAGTRLSAQQKTGLARICFEVSVMLGYNGVEAKDERKP